MSMRCTEMKFNYTALYSTKHIYLARPSYFFSSNIIADRLTRLARIK